MTKARGVTTSFTPLVIASSRLDFLDHYGVPYTVRSHRQQGALGYLRGVDGTARLLWPEMQSGTASIARLDEFPLLAPVLCDAEAEVLLAEIGLEWKACGDILGPGGESVGTIRRATDGSVFIPFDPNLAERVVLTEAYVPRLSTQAGGLARAVARHAYYWIRPALPRTAQMAMRRRFARVQDRTIFPRWPAETALHDLQEWLMSIIQLIAGHPIPQIHWWPEELRVGRSILTHDVERPARLWRVRELWRSRQSAGLAVGVVLRAGAGLRVEASLLDELRDGGFEVALHGLKHDGRRHSARDLRSSVFRQCEVTRRHGVQRGFGLRQPSRSEMGADRSLWASTTTSYSDVAPYDRNLAVPARWRPVLHRGCRRAADHVADGSHDFRPARAPGLRRSGIREGAVYLRARGGMAMLLTHPGLSPEPHRHAMRMPRSSTRVASGRRARGMRSRATSSVMVASRATFEIESADATWLSPAQRPSRQRRRPRS